MKRWKGWAVLLLFVVAGACAAEDSRADGPAMWRLDTLGATVYFLGSFHILPPDLKWRDDRVDEAMAEADTVVFEVNDDEMHSPDAVAMMQQRAFLPDGKKLADLVDPGTYAQVRAVAGRIAMPMALLDRVKPWYAGVMLTAGYMIAQGYSPDAGVDGLLQHETNLAGKTLMAFETLEQQLDALDSMSSADPDAILWDTLRYLEDDSGMLDEVVTAWRTGDTEKLEAILVEDIAKYRDVYDALITRRNRAWVPQIEAMLDQGGTYFIVVGAAHLVGPDSVVEMLEQKGLKAKRF